MRGSSDSRRFDAIVVGAALGGLASAAILANRGWRVAVVDPLPQVGGRVGAVESDGYWISWGHRDGHGIGDLAFFPVHTSVAAKEAGVELRLRPFLGNSLRVHWLPEGRAAELPADTLLPESGDPFEQMRELCRFFGDVGEADVDAVAREVLDVFARLAAVDDDEAWRLVPVRMGDWLARNVANPAARRVILQQFECMPFTPSSETSLGRFILHRRHVQGGPVVPDDYEVGGMQGVIAPFARRVEANGGEIWLGWKPLEILLEDDEVRGVVALDSASLVQVLEAPVVITDYEGWRLPELVPERRLPSGWLEAARRTERYAADAVCWWAGLRRLPTRREDGQVEDGSSPWQRILRGGGSVRAFHGGFYFPSMSAPRSAPEGKHLLCVEIVASGEEEGRKWPSWDAAQQAIDRNVVYLHDYYSDLDDCVEWSRYQYVTPPQYLSWYTKPIYRHPVKVRTIGGLYVAASSSEGVGSWLDIECAAALEAVRLAEEERGLLRRV